MTGFNLTYPNPDYIPDNSRIAHILTSSGPTEITALSLCLFHIWHGILWHMPHNDYYQTR
jgi:hypothetical protein